MTSGRRAPAAQTPPVPAYWNGRPVVAAVKLAAHEAGHAWLVVTEEPAGTGYVVRRVLWHGAYVAYVPAEVSPYACVVVDESEPLEYAEAVATMLVQSGVIAADDDEECE